MQACRKYKATLLIAKLDRLSRNVAFIASLLDSNIKFVCCDMPEADKTFLQMLAVFAEWEREKISERTKAALAAKAVALAGEGKKLGGPKAGREAGAIGWKANKKNTAFTYAGADSELGIACDSATPSDEKHTTPTARKTISANQS